MSDCRLVIGLGMYPEENPTIKATYSTSSSEFTSSSWIECSSMHRAVSWARTVGLTIMLDLHGAPGSQVSPVAPVAYDTNYKCKKNGFDNSGQLTSNPSWYEDENNIA